MQGDDLRLMCICRLCLTRISEDQAIYTINPHTNRMAIMCFDCYWMAYEELNDEDKETLNDY